MICMNSTCHIKNENEKNLEKQEKITIEIVTHYPICGVKNIGTFHAYIIEGPMTLKTGEIVVVNMDWDLRGCRYQLFENGAIKAFLPSFKQYDPEEEKKFQFATCGFGNFEKNEALKKALRAAFIEYATKENLTYEKPKSKEKKPKSDNSKNLTLNTNV